MKDQIRRPDQRLCRWAMRIFCLVAVIGILTCSLTPAEAGAERYDPKKAGNPVRIAAYLLHPVGVLIDYGLMRPCFWLVQREPFSTIFGYERPKKEDLPEYQ
jgi:hypothetical protein